MINDKKALADEGHGWGWFSAATGQDAREKFPMGVAPVGEGAVAFAFVVGELGVYFVVRPHCHLYRLNDTQWLVSAVEDNGEFAYLGRLGTYMSTIRKQGLNIWEALGSLSDGDVLMPQLTPV